MNKLKGSLGSSSGWINWGVHLGGGLINGQPEGVVRKLLEMDQGECVINQTRVINQVINEVINEVLNGST